VDLLPRAVITKYHKPSDVKQNTWKVTLRVALWLAPVIQQLDSRD
jgi:hypothetical protein